MKTSKLFAQVAAISFFTSCGKNEVVEPAVPTTAVDAAHGTPPQGTNPLFETDTPQQDPVIVTVPNLDADTPAETGSTDPSGSEVPSLTQPLPSHPVDGVLPLSLNLEVQ